MARKQSSGSFMERRNFLKYFAVSAGSVILGGSAVYRFFSDRDNKVDSMASQKNPSNIEVVNSGSGKKTLVLMSSRARHGNTDNLADAFIKGLVEKNHTVTKAYIGDMALTGCRGCGACQRNGGRCAINDDMQKLYPLFKDCDILVMASPLYFGTITSRLKAFVERLYAISVHDQYPEKETTLLMTAGDDRPGTFDWPIGYYKHLSGVFGGHDLGNYCAGGCTGCENIARHIAPEHLEKAYQLGLSI